MNEIQLKKINSKVKVLLQVIFVLTLVGCLIVYIIPIIKEVDKDYVYAVDLGKCMFKDAGSIGIILCIYKFIHEIIHYKLIECFGGKAIRISNLALETSSKRFSKFEYVVSVLGPFVVYLLLCLIPIYMASVKIIGVDVVVCAITYLLVSTSSDLYSTYQIIKLNPEFIVFEVNNSIKNKSGVVKEKDYEKFRNYKIVFYCKK